MKRWISSIFMQRDVGNGRRAKWGGERWLWTRVVNYTHIHTNNVIVSKTECFMFSLQMKLRLTSTFEIWTSNTHILLRIEYNCDDKCYIIINIKFKLEYTPLHMQTHSQMVVDLRSLLVMMVLLQQRHSYFQLCKFMTQFFCLNLPFSFSFSLFLSRSCIPVLPFSLSNK